MAEDEASLYLQATLTRVWAPIGQTPVVVTDPGRDKVHFYGTLNLGTGCVFARRSEQMNAEVTAQYLQDLLAEYPDTPILLLWDRAPWHRGEPIRQVLEANSRLEILFLPTAAPELNPQEHVWKATRTAVSHNHAVENLEPLADRFQAHLDQQTFTTTFLDAYGFNALCPFFN